MKRFMDTEEAARVLGVTPRAIRKKFNKGKLEGEFVSNKRGGRGGQVLKVWIDDMPAAQKAEGSEQKAENKDRYRVHRGEPGCRVVTPLINGEPIINIDSEKNGTAPILSRLCKGGINGDSPQIVPSSSPPSPCEVTLPSQGTFFLSSNPTGWHERLGISDSTNRANRVCDLLPPEREERRECVASTGLTPDHIQTRQDPEDPAGQCAQATSGINLPAIRKDRIANPKQEEIAYLRMALLKAWREMISENGKPKGRVTKEFLELYNFKFLLPNIFGKIKEVRRATLYNWDQAERSGGVAALIPQYHAPAPGPITESEKYILLNCLLHQNRLKVGTAIKFTKTFLAYKKMASPSSESKLRRFADDFKKTRYDVWVEAREGAKALNDKCLPYAERDWRFLTVGEGLVADGHRLNFQVIDPFTGKPCRATIVLFWDWKSSYPLGWEIMLEESTQCIASALRNAILTLGKVPKWLLIDNGKAFKAKCFTSEIELEDGILYGMFATLGIHTHFSQAYNPQEKPLERFWGTFNNWFERLLPSYTGASIEDKPAYMRRNEKDAQARHNKWLPRIEQVQEMLHNWREFYADQRSRGRDEMTPREIFDAEKGPGVDPGDLYHLMMVKETKAVHRNGITFNGWHYYNEALYGLKDNVLIKYSLSDFSQVFCFYKNQFLCVAKPIEPVHPMASEAECPKDREAVKQIGALKSKVRRGTKNLLNLIESGQGTDLEHSFRRSPEVAEVVKAIEDKRKPIKMTTAFVDDESMEHRAESIEKKEGIIVDPRTGLSRPGDGTVHEDQWEKYDWYMTVKKETPDALNNLDHEWIAEYEATDQWSRIYAKHAIGGEK